MSALLRLQEQGILSVEALQDLETRAVHAPGWLAVLQGIAAWIAASMIMFAFILLFSRAFNNLLMGTCGVLLMGAAVFLFYRKDNTFFSQLALAFSLAGQALLAIALGEGSGNDRAFLISALVAAAMTLPRSTLLHRSLCSLLALYYFSGFVFFFTNHATATLLKNGLPRLEMLGVLFAALSVALWFSRERWAAHQQAVRFKALAHAGMLMNLGFMGLFCLFQRFPDFAWERLAQGASLPIYAWGAALLFLAVCLWSSRKLPLAHRAVLGIAALILALAAFNAPWLLVCASLSLASFYACHKGWFAVTLACAVLLLGQFYYDLESTLLVKSGVLILSGGVLLALRAILRYWQKETA